MNKNRSDITGKNIVHCSRICRGQIWFVRQDQSLTDAIMASNTAVMGKSRPYLIISSDYDIINKKSILYGYPCTTNIQGNWIADENNDVIVSYYNWKGELEVTRIMTACLTPLDYSSIETYKFQLNSNLMKKIDAITMKHLFNSGDSKTLSETNTENKSVLNNNIKNIPEKENSVPNTATISKENTNKKEINGKANLISNANVSLDTDIFHNNTTPEKYIEIPPKKRIHWSKGQCEEFIKDIQNKKKGEVMKKYGITSDISLYQRKSYVQKKLKNFNHS